MRVLVVYTMSHFYSFRNGKANPQNYRVNNSVVRLSCWNYFVYDFVVYTMSQFCSLRNGNTTPQKVYRVYHSVI